jgi:hypothetical protein
MIVIASRSRTNNFEYVYGFLSTLDIRGGNIPH